MCGDGLESREFQLSDKPTSLFRAAWVVNDLEESIRRWIATARVGPFFVVSHAKVERVKYRGTRASVSVRAN
jgi:hypothetical protein